MKLFSIKDTKALAFAPALMPYHNKFACMRELSTIVNTNEKSLLFQYPQDFELYQVGEIDEKTGSLTAIFEYVCNLQELKSVREAS